MASHTPSDRLQQESTAVLDCGLRGGGEVRPRGGGSGVEGSTSGELFQYLVFRRESWLENKL